MRYIGIIITPLIVMLVAFIFWPNGPNQMIITKAIQHDMAMRKIDYAKVENLEIKDMYKVGQNRYVAYVAFDMVMTKNAEEIKQNDDIWVDPKCSLINLPDIHKLGAFKAGNHYRVETMIRFVENEKGVRLE